VFKLTFPNYVIAIRMLHKNVSMIYLTGLISVYDKEQFNKSLSDESSYRPHRRTPQFSRSRTDLQCMY